MRCIYKYLFFFLFFQLSCKEDTETTAPYKETAVVYGLLNPADKIQYIRLNKSFSGEGDLSQMLQESDSINFNPSNLTVKLEHYINGNLVNDQISLKDTFINIEPGTFSSKQLFYITRNTIKADSRIMDSLHSYKLSIFNKKNNA